MSNRTTDAVAPGTDAGWVDICGVDDVVPDRGVAAIVGAEVVAVFRLAANAACDESWHGIDHVDPITGAPVLARGLVGSADVDGRVVPTVASPLHKQRYDLCSGVCLDDPSVSVRTWDVSVCDGRVRVARS